MHASKYSYMGREDDGKFILPILLHLTLCGKTVKSVEISHLPDCEECNEVLTWEEIDKHQEVK